MQNISILQAQIDSLKEMIDLMERSNPDTLAKKWRAKVFEELVKNKQQQIQHNIELKKFKEEEKKFRSKESQIKAALESAHLQASSLNLERNKLQKEVQILQSRIRNSNINSNFLLNLQATLTNNLELNAKVLAMLDTFNHRITFSMSKIKTAKILHTREIFALRNKLTEETNDQKQLLTEFARLSTLEKTQSSLIYENESLQAELEGLKNQFQQAENLAKCVLEETNNRFKDIVAQLEAQLDDKVSENNEMAQKIALYEKNIEKMNRQVKELNENRTVLEQEKEILRLTVQDLQNNVQGLNHKCENLVIELKQVEENCKAQDEIICKLQEKDGSALEESREMIQNIQEKEKCIEELVCSVQKLEEELFQAQGANDALRAKIGKLESANKEFRRERDILFETVKKSGNQRNRDDKEVQTDTQVKTATLKKAQPRPHKTEDNI